MSLDFYLICYIRNKKAETSSKEKRKYGISDMFMIKKIKDFMIRNKQE
jgi:hypothetical protein